MSTPQGVMDSKTQPRADVSPDVDWSDADSPKVDTPPPEAVVAGAHADGAETSRSEDEGKLHQAAAPMSKSQGLAGDHINAKITRAGLWVHRDS